MRYNEILVPFIVFGLSEFKESLFDDLDKDDWWDVNKHPFTALSNLFSPSLNVFFKWKDGSHLPFDPLGRADDAIFMFESYLRMLISNSATKIYMPQFQSAKLVLKNRNELSEFLPPSLMKRFAFVDETESTWRDISKYLVRIFEQMGHEFPVEVAWNLYMLALGCRSGSEVVLSPENTLNLILKAKNHPALDSESLSRLSVIEGIFSHFAEQIEGTFLQPSPTITRQYVSDRIEEIIEDAYFLESSKIRKLFGLRENIISLKRDLRAIVRSICKTQKWAKGFFQAGSYFFSKGAPVFEAMEKLTSIIPGVYQEKSAPIIIHGTTKCLNPQSSGAIFHYRNLSGTMTCKYYYKTNENETPWIYIEY